MYNIKHVVKRYLELPFWIQRLARTFCPCSPSPGAWKAGVPLSLPPPPLRRRARPIEDFITRQVRKHNLLTFGSFVLRPTLHLRKALLGLCVWKCFSLFIFKLCLFEKEIKAGNFYQETNDVGREGSQPFIVDGIKRSKSNQNTWITWGLSKTHLMTEVSAGLAGRSLFFENFLTSSGGPDGRLWLGKRLALVFWGNSQVHLSLRHRVGLTCLKVAQTQSTRIRDSVAFLHGKISPGEGKDSSS